MNGLKLFFHNSKYTMLSMFRLKVTLFWTLAFPLLLATFMYMAFGNLFEKDEMFKTINVAVVESENDDTLMSVLESLDVTILIQPVNPTTRPTVQIHFQTS